MTTEQAPVKEAVSDDPELDGDAERGDEVDGLSGQEERGGEDSHVPYDRGWAWMISMSCFVILYVYCTFDQVVSVLLVDIMKELDTTVSVISIMFSLNTWFYCISTQLTTNVLLKYVSNRSLETAAALLNVLATLIFIISPRVELLLTASFIKAISRGTALIPTLTMVGYYFRKRRALAIALGLMGASVCSVTVPPLARYLRDEYGTRGCFLLISGVELQAVLATMLLRPLNSYSKRRSSRVLVNAPEGSEEEKKVLMPRTLTSQLPSDDNIEEKEAETIDTERHGVNEVSQISSSSDPLQIQKHQSVTNSHADNFITVDNADDNMTNQSKSDIQPKDITEVRENRTDSTLKKAASAHAKHQSAQQMSTTSADSFQYDEHNHANPQTHRSEETGNRVHVPRKDQADISLSRSYQIKWSSTTSSILGSAIEISPAVEPPRDTVKPRGGQPNPKKFTLIYSWINVIINFELLKNVSCILIFCIYCLTNAALLNMMYLPTYARKVGVLPQDAAILLTIIGTCDMAARVLSGFIVDSKLVRVNVVMAVAIFCLGVVSQFLGMFLTFEHLIVFSVMQGLLGSVGSSLNTMLIVETLGIEFLSKVLPMCSLFLGVTTAVQQLIIGALIEKSGNFVVAFNYVGTMYILAAVLLLSVPLVKRLQLARESKKDSVT